MSANIAADKVRLAESVRTALDVPEAGTSPPPGWAVAVLIGGEVVHVAGHGVLRSGEKEPVRPDTVFRLMSMSKAVTAVAALVLVERGMLELSRTVAHYLPAFATMPVAGESAPPADPMRVRHLLTHTSGLLRGTGPHPVERGYAAAGILPGQRGHYSLAEFCDRLAGTNLAFRPGTHFGYGFSTDVLGRVLEVTAGVPLDEVLAELVLEPLGLTDTGFTAPPGEAGRVATLHGVMRGRDVPLDADWPIPVNRPPMLSGGAGLLSTAGDYSRFVAMLAGGGAVDGARVLSPGSVRRMTRNQLPGAGTIETLSGNGPAGGTGDPPGTYAGVGHGLGVAVVEKPTDHGHRGEYGWSGASGSVFFVDPAAGLALVVLANRFGPHNAAWRRRLHAAVHSALE